ncbi:universal stress protein [Sphingobacterium bovistauri]|uniref:Universal stress protein n=1 Tax=Sphingobacterium bovistauri TaxID=2781959 RepID=A0ABS7Z2R2_9SPHI|nr:universal stress protein [Sphingobacterium bovistauri]MCA5004459.1 universal stress protein [Sphingobacterium bovistauri]
MTKKILVPTDFSKNALVAAQYACEIAKENDYDIHLFHCYTTSTATEMENSSQLKADFLIQELKEQLTKEYSSLVITTECVSRLLTDVLPDYAVQPDFVLIIMGTTGAGQGKSVIWGSNTSYITSKSKIPVIAIPNNVITFSSNKIAILTNFKAEEIETLNTYIQNVSSINELDIIHIYKDNKKAKDIEQQLQDWTFNIKQLSDIGSINIIAQPIQHDNEDLDTVPEVINHIINNNNYDIILVTKTRKSFFERIISTSVSRQITLSLQKPTFFDNI